MEEDSSAARRPTYGPVRRGFGDSPMPQAAEAEGAATAAEAAELVVAGVEGNFGDPVVEAFFAGVLLEPGEHFEEDFLA